MAKLSSGDRLYGLRDLVIVSPFRRKLLIPVLHRILIFLTKEEIPTLSYSEQF